MFGFPFQKIHAFVCSYEKRTLDLQHLFIRKIVSLVLGQKQNEYSPNMYLGNCFFSIATQIWTTRILFLKPMILLGFPHISKLDF